MLNLTDPIELEGLTLYRDDVDVRKFYLLPDRPAIRRGEGGAPEVLFIKYFAVGSTAAEDVGGGYVQLRASLAIDPERRERVREALRARLEDERSSGARPHGHAITSTEPLLAAPTWTRGEVRLFTFAATDDGIVTQAAVTSVPDLTSDLGASAVIELDPYGAEIFWTSFESGQLPIVLAYDVSYLARVPAGSLTITAKREAVKTTLWTHARAFVWRPAKRRYEALPDGPLGRSAKLGELRRRFAGDRIIAAVPDRQVRTLLRTTIEVQVRSGLAADGELPLDLRERMLSLATELISDSLIGPALFGGRIPGAAVEGGEALSPLAELDELPDSDFRLEVAQDGVVERRIAPNGPLALLAGRESLEGLFVQLDPNSEFFSVLDVLATSEGVRYEEDGVLAVLVEVQYEQVDDPTGQAVRPPRDQQPQRRLSAEHPEARWRFRLARRAGGGFKREYRYRTRVIYRSSQPDSVSEWHQTGDQILHINPRSLLALRVDLELVAPPAAVDAVDVELAYTRADGVAFQSRRALTPAAPKQSWFCVTGELREHGEADPEYAYRCTWSLPGVGQVVGDWQRSRDRTLALGSPLARALRFSLRPQGFDEHAAHLAGTLVYRHPARDYEVRRAFELASGAASQEIEIPTLPDGPAVASVSWRLVLRDGSARDGQLEGVEPGLVWVGPSVARRLHVEVTPVLLDFEHDVRLAVVRLHYADPAHGIDERKTLQFMRNEAGAHLEPQSFTVAVADATKMRYDAVIDLVGYDGARQRIELPGQSDSLIMLDRGMAPPPN